jgi:hypothetical protein
LLIGGAASSQTGMPLGTEECTVLADARGHVIAVLRMPEAVALEVCEYIALVRREGGKLERLELHTTTSHYIVAEPSTVREITA